MKAKCPKCKHVNMIDWNVKGWGLKEMRLMFVCKMCGLQMGAQIVFPPDGKKEKPKIKFDYHDDSYIG